MWEGWEGCTRSPPGLRTTAPRIDGTRARFPRFPHPPPPLRRCLWEGWEGRPRPHPPAAPGPSHSERARARFPRFPQDSTAIPAALRPKDPWHNAPRRRQAAEKTKNGRKPAGFAASPHHRRPLSYPLAFSWRVHRENWPASPTAGRRNSQTQSPASRWTNRGWRRSVGAPVFRPPPGELASIAAAGCETHKRALIAPTQPGTAPRPPRSSQHRYNPPSYG